MKQFVCEMCGGTNLVKQEGMYICQDCGTRYSVEEARKLMQDVPDDVAAAARPAPALKPAVDTELENLYVLARRAKNDNNSENAQKYYEQIIVKDPSSWEANFYTTYFQSMNCKIGEIGTAAVRVSNCEDTVLNLIKEHVTDPAERRNAVDEVAARLISISNMLFNAYKNHYDGIGASIKANYTQEYANTCAAARDIVYNGGNWIVKLFGDEYGDLAAACWKLGVKQHNILNNVYIDKQANANIINEYNQKILKYDPSYQVPATNMGTLAKSGCYVATAVYGSYDCPQVWTLRRYRDYTLAETWYGRAFIRTYYAISPTLVKWFGDTEWFKKMWRGKLDRMVANLQAEGVEDTPYEDRNW